MSDLIPFGESPFDANRRFDERGEYWFARELMPLLGYGVWRDFANAIDRAKITAANSGADVNSNFADARKISSTKPGADYRLTRYACYLVAMNGDPRKPEIAAAQTYFAVKTREAEIAEVPQLSEVEVAERWLAALKREKALEAKVAEQEPKVEAFNEFLTADGDYQVATVAQMLGMGQNRLFALLRDEGVLIAGGRRHNTPNQQYMRHFRVVATTYDDGEREHATFRTYVKPSGVDFIRKVLKLQALIPGGAA